MRLRLSSIDEFQLLTCFKHGLWGAKTDRFGDWQEGDLLLLLVQKRLAALTQVSGKTYKSSEKIWDNGLYPYRIPIKFSIILEPDNRPLVLGDIRDGLTAAWGPNYGWGILNQQLLKGDLAEKLVSATKAAPNSIESYKHELSQRLEAADAERIAKAASKEPLKPKKLPKPVAIPEVLPGAEEQPTQKEASAHHKTQATLKALGKLTGCSVWIATNDKGKEFKGKALSEGTLPQLPSLGLSEDAVSRISLIDVIWIQQGAPVCAFEVEATTSIYSGLLRMSDLLAVVPALKLNLFIVAPKERIDKFFAQLSRPTFRKIGLSDYCRFVSIEDLEELAGKVSNLKGIQHSVIESIATQLEEEITA
jgi:hypothetical protein